MPCLSNSILFFCVCFFILIVFFKIILMTYLLNSLQWNPFWDPWMPFLLALFHFCLVALQSMSNLNDYNIFLCFFFCHLHFPSASIHKLNKMLFVIHFFLAQLYEPIQWYFFIIYHVQLMIHSSFYLSVCILICITLKVFIFTLKGTWTIEHAFPWLWTICISHKNNHFQVTLHDIKISTYKHINCTLIQIFNFSSNVGKWYFSPTNS